MHNWQENEIKELLTIRGSEAIRNQITGTAKDSVVYNRMTRLLAERGVYRSHMQIVSKLKALRKQYTKYHQLMIRCGTDRVDWPFYEQCHQVFSIAPSANPVKRRRRSPTSSTPTSPTPANREEHQEVVVSLWDEVDEADIQKQLGPVEAEEDEEQYSSSEHLQPIMCTVPSRKRKTTVMEQVSTLVSATVTQLKEMDAAMQAQEDARLQRLMDHEKEMQNSLMSQLVNMHERISRENHERHLELVDRILSRFPSPSAPSAPSDH
ncbi:uncharacterized protein LOC128356766 [Scomber scombrus]|uniref:Uncharacterized protein LOC128356766 n=1 Tax=Scomber scombrus TaxID=13677 RepID=A0AAV1PML7_SCOSC|nr:uncharacterized protein LOC133988095 [Scomber scombrus]